MTCTWHAEKQNDAVHTLRVHTPRVQTSVFVVQVHFYVFFSSFFVWNIDFNFSVCHLCYPVESPDTRHRNIDLDQTGLNVVIEAGPDGTGYDVSATGTTYNIITADEADTWGIGSTYDLMNAIQAHFGKKPNEAWLSSPAGSNELYDTYGWEQVI